MSLAHFKALNADSSEESDGDVENPSVTREALEEKAVSEYTKILFLVRNKQWEEAKEGLKNLLESDVLSRVTGNVNYIGGKLQPSLVHLKYCVLVNLGHVLTELNQIKTAVDYYLQAVNLDDTDLNLWYKIGRAAIKIPNLNLASYSFQEALRCNPNHWPSLDTLITVLYASGNFLLCLYFISEGLEKDSKFLKGVAFGRKILDEHPSFKRDFPLYYPQCLLDEKLKQSEVDMEDEAVVKMLEEANKLKKSFETLQWPRENKDEVLTSVKPERPLRKKSWVTLGRSLLQVYSRLKEEYPEISFYRHVDLSVDDDLMEVVVDNEEKEDFLDDQLIDEEVDKINENVAESEETGSRNKRRKSSPSLLEQWMPCSKRRSARVRSTVRKDEPTLARTLHNLLPQKWRPLKDDRKDREHLRYSEDSMDTMDMYRLFEIRDGTSVLQESNDHVAITNNANDDERARLIDEENYFNKDMEINDVNVFIKENNCSNILTLLNNYVRSVSSLWKLWWPSCLNTVYLKIYKIIRLHSPENCQSSESLDFSAALSVLLYGELLLDYWLLKGKEQGLASPITGSVFGGEFCTLSFGDLNYVCDDSEDSEFIIRCYWLEALMCLHAGNTQSTLIVLQKYMSDERCDNVEVKLYNVKNHYIVNTDLIERLYNTLLRNKSLDEVKKLFTEKKYEKVSEILIEALLPTARLLTADFVEPVVDRCTQFSLLLDSLLELERYDDCFVWCELCCHEAMNNCRNGLEDPEGYKSKWLVLLANGLQALPYCIDQGGHDIFSKLPDNKLIRLIQTLSSVVCHQIESSDGTDIPFETISPWILLYEILKYHENISGYCDDEIPNSLTLLFTAHEYLGRRSWCLNDDAEILFKTLTILLPIMESTNPDAKMLILNQQMEQIFYCLYGHPVKRNRPRYVQDHNVDSLSLTWPRSQLVYKFLKPRELPMYDSSARYSISQDVEILFREIVSLIPTENNPTGLIEKLNSYIEGTSNELPLNKSFLPVELVDIYYLIADYNFKNKLWSKAIKYYILDVCANPNRVDSWACLALARGSQLETKLNSCEPIKNESDFLKRAKMSCRCYQRSLQLDPEQSTLWIEYGSFSYMVHSFCSRLLNQEQNLSLELFEILETQKDEMLETAFKCFSSANMLWTRFEKMGVEPEIQDERWLHHYMLGKISEKKEDKPFVYLNHFVKSIKFLHLNNAEYPEHISYSNPQHYSVEALELYYRVHACILKSLEQSEDHPISKDLRRFFFEILEKSACGPFANFGEFIDLEYKTDSHNDIVDGYNNDMDCESADDIPLVEKEVKYVLNNILIQIAGQDDDSSRKRKLSHSVDELEDIEDPNCKKIKTEEQEGSDLEVKVNSDNAKILLSQKSKDSDSGNDSKHEMSDDRSQDSKKISKKAKSQDSSSETLSDSDTSSSDSDSSDDSSSSEESDSSSSDSSQQDSSDDDKPPPAKKLKMANCDSGNWKEEQRCLIDRCLCAMEECVRRFPEHYKSIYRQAHYYFRSKVRSDSTKVRKLFLGEGGLFADRKVNNFFNGVWRIPSSEIDRPGSFAGHMSRCSHLLLDLLRDSRDHRMLFALALQLKDTPEPDKKYLRDEEREQLAKESVTLSVQAFRHKLHEARNTSEIFNILNEAYKYYKRINKLWPQRDSAYVSLVTQCFTRYLKSRGENKFKCTFEAAVKFFQDGTLIPIPTPAPVISMPEPVPPPPQKLPQSQQHTEVVSTTVSNVTTSAVLPSPTSTSITTTSTISSNLNNVTSAAASIISSPAIKAVQPPSTPLSMPVKRPRGRPAGSSVRHPNPLSQMLKNFPGMSKDLQMLYKNFPYSPQQLLSVMRTNPMLAMQAASLSVQQQFSTVQAEIIRQLNIVQSSQKQPTSSALSTSSSSKSNIMQSSTLSPLTTAPKDHPNLTITAVPSSTKTTPSSSNSQSQRSGTKSQSSKYNVKSQSSANAKQANKPRDPMTIPSVSKSSLPPVTKSPVPSVSKSLMPSVSKSPIPPVSKSPMLCSPPIIKNQTPNLPPFNPVISPASVRHPMSPNIPISGGTSGSDMSLQHKLLSAKRNKQPSLSQKKEIDLPNIRFDKDLSVQSANKNLIDMSKNSYNDNKLRGMSGPGSISISKFQSKVGGSSEQPKQLPKDLALTVSTVNNDLSSKLSSLSPKEITLMRLTQNIGGDNIVTTSGANSINNTNIKNDKVTVSFMDNINKNKAKQLNLPQRQQDLAQIQQMATNLTSSYRKQMPTVVDNRISALKAIGTQLTITSTATGPSSNTDVKKQETVVNCDKAEVTIVPPKEKQKKDSCEIIFLE